MGSAVDEAQLTRELERFATAGFGGVHIIPIYQANGYESRARPYLGPAWMAALEHVLRETRRLGLGVDMTTGTGWCFGGPTITDEHAAARLRTDARDVQGQTPVSGRYDLSRLDALIAYGPAYERIDLRSRIGTDGTLAWTPPAGRWRIYGLSSTPSIKVKRAAPGGEGWMLDPFSPDAMRRFLAPFTSAFDGHPGGRPRALYHDSFEYGADWSRGLLDAFAHRRGYRLENELPAFIDGTPADRAARVKHDYRQTLDELLVDEVFPIWIAWAHDRGLIARNEAHGAPANLLDFYALADVPETEMFRADRNVRVSRVASSAAHVTGRRLVSAETGTWLAEHFHETLASLKDLVDQLFVSGVNHVFYHGSAYSPDEAAWPGWIFYASTQMNARNAIWHDVPSLNAYIARVQAVLQDGEPDQDVLLYWPIHDLWQDARGTAIPLAIHDPSWLERQPVGDVARRLDASGVTYDYVSDRQLAGIQVSQGTLVTGDARYAAIVVPPTTVMPPATFEALVALADAGGSIVFDGDLPSDVPGLERLDERRTQLSALRRRTRPGPATEAGRALEKVGHGRILIGRLESVLSTLPTERFADLGLEFVRRRTRGGDSRAYFVTNRTDHGVRAWVRLGTRARRGVLVDPMTGARGGAMLRHDGQATPEVFLSLDRGSSILIMTDGDETLPDFPFWRVSGARMALDGPWTLRFVEGGPELPRDERLRSLLSWSDLEDPRGQAFAGTAVYQATFDTPLEGTGVWRLDLGAVHETARIRVNGRDRGTLIGPSYTLVIDGLQPRGNVLELEVTNLSANRLRDLDRRHVPWRLFHDINVVNLDYQPLDASNWPLLPSGVLGPVTLTPVTRDEGRP
jgi:hypothetical protein